MNCAFAVRCKTHKKPPEKCQLEYLLSHLLEFYILYVGL